jgi:hypothetical protein
MRKKLKTMANIVGIGICLCMPFILYVENYIRNSGACKAAKEFLSHDKQIIEKVGKVLDFGYIVTGHITSGERWGSATLNLKVIGERKNLTVLVYLYDSTGFKWKVQKTKIKGQN